MHTTIERLHQELMACVGEIWTPSANAHPLQVRPGWMLAHNPQHPCHRILLESLARLELRFSPEELTTMASDMYFNPLWWREATNTFPFHWDYGRSTDNYALSILETWIVENPPSDIDQRLDARLRQMFQNPYNSPEISLASGISQPPDYYLSPNVDTCLAMLAVLKPTPGLLDLAERILTSEFNYGPIQFSGHTQPEMSYRMYWLTGRFHDLIIYLGKNEHLNYEIYRKAVFSTRSMLSKLTLAPHRRQLLTPDGQCAEQIEGYQKRLLDETTRELSEENFKALLEMDLPLRGAQYLLRAAENHARLKTGKLSGQSHLPAIIQDAIVRLARAEAVQPNNDSEQQELIEQLRQFPAATLEALLPISVHHYRLLCDALGWENALPLIGLIIQIADFSADTSVLATRRYEPFDIPNSPEAISGAIDVAAVQNALEMAGEALAKKVIDLFGKAQVHVDNTLMLIQAVGGWNREKVEKSFQKHSQIAIKAYGLLPLQGGEDEVLERYMTLRKSAKEGQKFGQMRRATHAGAVQVALANLAQIAGYPDATRLEWAMEAKIAQDLTPTGRSWMVNDYEIQLQINGAEAAMTISRGGKTLKSVPKDVRGSPEYKEAQEARKQFRAQASRIRGGLLEGYVASGDAISPEELKRLLQLPAARDMMQRLIFRTNDGHFGMLDAENITLRDLNGAKYPVETDVIIAHPYDLFQNGILADWQREIVHQRIVQPIKQAFRELYLLTPAEQNTRTYSNRFAGHVIDGATAGRLLGGRGWRIEAGDVPLPYKIFPKAGLRAVFQLPDAQHFIGAYPVTTDRICFEPYPSRSPRRGFPEEHWLPLEEIPPLIFSEVMRDADLIVSVAQREGEARLSNETFEQRGDLVKALLDDLGLPGVTIEGHFAYVQGKLARYRVHLGSAVIHIEPGNYLCIVPDRWGKKHDKLFLPFADENDSKISEVISKILLLLADDKIKDESILRQIHRQVS